jgi:hypothetical protein
MTTFLVVFYTIAVSLLAPVAGGISDSAEHGNQRAAVPPPSHFARAAALRALDDCESSLGLSRKEFVQWMTRRASV